MRRQSTFALVRQLLEFAVLAHHDAMGWRLSRQAKTASRGPSKQALLDGYRQGLAAPGKGQAKLGPAGKGTGHTNADEIPPALCTWRGYRAAEAKQITRGSTSHCHACGKPFGQKRPLENLVSWAYELRLDQAKKKRRGENGRPQDCPPSRPVIPRRGAAAQEAAPGGDQGGGSGERTSETDPPTEEVGKVFIDKGVEGTVIDVARK